MRVRTEPLDHAIARARGPAALDHRHLGSLARMAADRRFDGASARQHALADRRIGAAHAAPLERRGERLLAREVARDEQQAARVLVEPMHEARARQHRERWVEVEQRILQRARPVTRARMHDQADGLVDHEQRLVAVHELQRNRFGLDCDRRRELGCERELLAALQQRSRARRLARQRELARVDPGLQAAPRELREQRGRRLIQTPSGQLGRHDQPALDPFHAAQAQGRRKLSAILHRQTSRSTHRAAHRSSSGSSRHETAAVRARRNRARRVRPQGQHRAGRGSRGPLRARPRRDGSLQLRRGDPVFHALEARYPFSNVTRQAQLDLIYLYYKSQQPESAIDAAEEFERENPTHARVDYCLYMRGRVYFDQAPNVLEKLFRVDLSLRPPKDTLRSFSTFQELVRRFPDSDIRGRCAPAHDFLAQPARGVREPRGRLLH